MKITMGNGRYSPREMEKWWGRVLISGSGCESKEEGTRGG